MLLESLLERHELAVPSLDQPILDLPRVTARLVPGQVLQQPVTMVKPPRQAHSATAIDNN